MKSTAYVAVSFLMLVSATAVAETDAEKAARKHEQEMMQLSKKNDGTVNALRRNVEGTWNWYVAKQAKNFAEITSNVNEIVRLVTLKEGAAKAMTVADAKLLLARAYAQPVNIRFATEAEKAYRDAIAAAPADGKVAVERELEKYLFSVGKGPAPAAVAEDAKPAATEQEALRKWFRNKVRTVSRNEKVDHLAKENCHDGKIEFCDQAVAELTDPRWHVEFLLRKADLLAEMSRWEDAEKIYLGELAKIVDVTSRQRVEWLVRLGELYAKRAARYYAKPDAALSAKALWYWEEAFRLDPKNGGVIRKIIVQAFLASDYDLAKKWLDAYVPLLKDQKADAWTSACYGDIAFFAGD